jgi:Enoyl-(Acyl carrier protein) reductase
MAARCPGAFPTEGMAVHLMPGGMGVSDVAANPMRRNGRPAELTNLVTFLLAPGSEFITGQTLAIDGAAFQAGSATFAHPAGWTDEQWREARAVTRAATSVDKAERSG